MYLLSISFSTIALAVDYESEPNDDFSTSDHFVAGDEQRGYFTTTSDNYDCYDVILRNNTNVTISLTNISAGCDFDVYFYSPTQQLLASGLNISNKSEFVRYSNLPSYDTYYIKVRRYNGTSSSYYSLSVTIGDKITSNTNSSYNESAAASYAYAHYGSNDPNFPHSSVDCTCFASSCVYSGGMSLLGKSSHSQTTSSWWYDMAYDPTSSLTWRAAADFQKHWTNVRSSNFYGRAYQVRIYTVEAAIEHWDEITAIMNPGDIVQHGNRSDCYAHHSQVVYAKVSRSGVPSGTDFWIAQHTDNALYSEYDYLVNRCSPTEWVWFTNIKQ